MANYYELLGLVLEAAVDDIIIGSDILQTLRVRFERYKKAGDLKGMKVTLDQFEQVVLKLEGAIDEVKSDMTSGKIPSIVSGISKVLAVADFMAKCIVTTEQILMNKWAEKVPDEVRRREDGETELSEDFVKAKERLQKVQKLNRTVLKGDTSNKLNKASKVGVVASYGVRMADDVKNLNTVGITHTQLKDVTRQMKYGVKRMQQAVARLEAKQKKMEVKMKAKEAKLTAKQKG